MSSRGSFQIAFPAWLLQEIHMRLSMSCQHKFIAFADYLPHKGLDSLVSDTHKAVDSVLKGYVFTWL